MAEKKDKRASRSAQIKRNAVPAGMTAEASRKRRDKDRLHAWTKKRREDPAYRAKCAAQQKAKHDRLVADAEFGRMCRAFLANVGGMLSEWANLRSLANAGAAQEKGARR